MGDMLSVRQLVERSKRDGIPATEYAIRLWIRRGELPARYAGCKALIFYPNYVRFVTGQDICEEGAR